MFNALRTADKACTSPVFHRPTIQNSTQHAQAKPMAGSQAARACQARTADARSSGGQQQPLPLWDAPPPWLRLLVNNPQLLTASDLTNLMSTSWTMCKAVLRCMEGWRLTVEVRWLHDLAARPSYSACAVKHTHDNFSNVIAFRSTTANTSFHAWYGGVGR
jgi:hypothetical protein